MEGEHDVAILGGGLAGLSLALHLKRTFPDLDIVVLERSRHPAPAGAHKVGESTVEIGAHYFSDTLGLRAHLDDAHIRKFGFRFFFSDGRTDIEATTELGVRRVLPTPTWQIDRGIFETFLAEEAQRCGIDFRDETRVLGVDIAGENDPHRIRVSGNDQDETLVARWLIDASGRAGLLRRKLGLDITSGHDANAVWFRLDDRITIDDWSSDTQWCSRCSPAERWRSTNHMVGPGYWVWLIPLSSGAHSIGIVADAGMHPIEDMNTFDKALAWLARHQPAVAQACESRRDKLMDFRFLRNYSHGCRQTFSADRWALTGDAGVFLDPFYSPGSDFIAITNTYIVSLIGHDRAGDRLAPYARIYQQLFDSFFENTMTLYRDQYHLFGNATVLPIKVLWDYAYYWGVLCQLVFQERLTDFGLLGEMRAEFEQARTLNEDMQRLFRDWHAVDPGHSHASMLDQNTLPWFTELNRGLHDTLDNSQLRDRLRANVALLASLAATIRNRSGLAESDVGATPADAQSSGSNTPDLFVI